MLAVTTALPWEQEEAVTLAAAVFLQEKQEPLVHREQEASKADLEETVSRVLPTALSTATRP